MFTEKNLQEYPYAVEFYFNGDLCGRVLCKDKLIALDHAEGCIKHGNQNYEHAEVRQRADNYLIKRFSAK